MKYFQKTIKTFRLSHSVTWQKFYQVQKKQVETNFV